MCGSKLPENMFDGAGSEDDNILPLKIDENDYEVLCAERAIFWAQQHGVKVSQSSVDAVAVYKKLVNGTFNLENDLVKPWNTKEALVATSTYATYGGEREMVSAGIEYIVVRISYLLINGYDAWTELFAFQGIAGESEQRWAKQFRVD